MCGSISGVSSVALNYVSLFMPLLHCLDYYRFILSLISLPSALKKFAGHRIIHCPFLVFCFPSVLKDTASLPSILT